MSDGNNRNHNFDDYLDLLNEYGKEPEKTGTADNNQKKDGVKEDGEKNSSSSQTKKRKISDDDIDLLRKADFFSDYEDEDSDNSEDKSSNEDYQEKEKYDFSLFEENNDDENPDDEGKMPTPPPMDEKDKRPDNKVVKWYKALPKKKQTAIKVVAIVLAVILTLIIVGGIFFASKFLLLGDKVGENDDDQIYEEQEIENIEIDIGSEGFKQALMDWATTGNDKHMSSKNVINVLLIGADSRKGTNTGNTDVMMLLSLNRKTKELKLISFLRDSYLYIEGKNNSYCSKLNAAFSMGGPEVLLKTIENNYKIDIDNYVMVNFKSFEAIIDAMGGVKVDVKQYEADYNYKKFKVHLPVGEGVTLNGKQALCFCRIRGCDADGDVSRTRRQRQVIDSIVNRVNSASISQLNKYINILLPYVDTGYSDGQILSLGIKALTGGWARYERTEMQMPPEDCRTSGSANMWIWVVDYQKAAYELQMEIYGRSNIVLDENRVTIIDVYRGANYTGNSGSSIKDEKDDEETVPETTVPLTENLSTTAKGEMGTTAPVVTTDENIDVDFPEESSSNEENQNKTEENTENTTEAKTEPPTETTPPTTAVPKGDE